MTKRSIALIVLLLMFKIVSAQGVTNRGTTWIGGTAGFSSVSSEEATRTSVLFAPNLNYFVNDNIFLGGSVTWQRVSEEGSGNSSFGIGPQLGLAFDTESGNSVPYVAGGFRYLTNRRDETGGFPIASSKGSDLFVAGGFNMVAKESLGILIEASYHIQSFDGGQSFNTFVLGIGLIGILN